MSRVSRPIAWRAVLGCESLRRSWGAGACMLWQTLGAYFCLSRAGIIFASKEPRRDHGHVLRRGDVVFFRDSTLLDRVLKGQTDRVEIWYKSSKGYQFGKVAVLTRVRAGSSLPMSGGSRIVQLTIERLSSYTYLPLYAQLAAFEAPLG